MRRACSALLLLTACAVEPPSVATEASSAREAKVAGLHVVSAGPQQRPSFAWALDRQGASSDDPVEAARAHLLRHAEAYGLTASVIEQASLRSVSEAANGTRVVQLYRRAHGVEVYPSETRVLMRADGSLVAISGALPDRVAPDRQDGLHISPREALTIALRAILGPEVSADGLAVDGGDDETTWFVARPPSRLVLPYGARVRRILYRSGPVPRWAYLTEVYAGRDDLVEAIAARYIVAAKDGAVLDVRDLTDDVAFTYRVWAENTGDLRPLDGPVQDFSPHPTGTPDDYVPGPVPSNLVTVEAFNTNPLGRGDPWLPRNATETRGNNVDAYIDHNSPDGFSNGDIRARTTGSRRFDHAVDTTLAPDANETQIMGSITQLFYTINWLHDYWYDSGFDEAAGNAQADNFGRGGEGGDALRAEAQDSLPQGARNNANMSTPSDGIPPRMQVYVWTGRRNASVTLSSRANPITAVGVAGFGPSSFSVSAAVVDAQDGSGSATDACQALTNDVTGRVVLVDRGSCSFGTKAINVQNAGGLAMLLANNRGGNPPGMGGTPPGNVTIGSLSITQAEGTALRTALGAGPVTATLARATSPDLDATLDSSLVAHEWGHYIHRRLADCGAIQCRGMSEGWGDFLGMHTQLRAGDDLSGTYSSAGYSTLGRVNGTFFGVRRYAYSADRSINDLSFRHIADGESLPGGPTDPSGAPNSQVHNTGEVWASMLLEGYLALQEAAATSTTGRTFEQVRRAMSDYVVVSLMMTPDDATFVESRDAMLAAAYAANVDDYDLLFDAFVSRGIGSCAEAPARDSPDNSPVVEDVTRQPQIDLVEVRLSDDDWSCDGDRRLDLEERGRLRLTVANLGHAPLTGARVVLSSTSALSFSDGNIVNIPDVDPLATAQLDLGLALDPAFPPGPARVALAVRLEAPEGCEPVVTSTVYFRVDADELDVSTVDDVEAETTSWRVGGDLTDLWSRVEHAPFDHAWLSRDHSTFSDTWLVSPTMLVGTSTSFVVTLDHRYRFEADADDGSAINWDGGVIEISTDDGQTWQDVEAWVDPGYRGTLTDRSGNPLADRRALVGTSPAWPDFEPLELDFGLAFAGQRARIRFHIGTDAGAGDFGWQLDNLAFAGIDNAPYTAVIADLTECPIELWADAGPDQSVPAGAAVALDGSDSQSYHGRPLSYAWRQTGGPAVGLERADRPVAVFTAPADPAGATLTFELEVSDGPLTATDDVEIVVEAAPQAPLRADAGEDQSVATGAAVALDGSGSVGPSGITFAWTQVDGPAVSLEGADRAVARFDGPDAPEATTLTFELVVSDGDRTDRDTTVVTVAGRGDLTADAGPDQTVAGAAAVVLDGRASQAPSGATFSWRQVDGPQVTLQPADAAVTAFEAPVSEADAALTFELSVTDGDRTATDEVVVTVTGTPAPPPVQTDDGCRCVRPGRAPAGLALLFLAACIRRRRR